jgi:hypothetical protein
MVYIDGLDSGQRSEWEFMVARCTVNISLEVQVRDVPPARIWLPSGHRPSTHSTHRRPLRRPPRSSGLDIPYL